MHWPTDDLAAVAAADDLHISPFRDDGVTYGAPTWIWSVTVDVYDRAYNGTRSRWYQAAMRQTRGRITAAGMTRDVAFEPIVGDVNDRVDEAYRAKYRRSLYLSPMIGARAVPPRSRSRLLRVPRDCVRQFCLPMRSSWTG